MRFKQHLGRKLRIETLEQRAMLKGSVSTVFDNVEGGVLELTGDNSANQISIHQVAQNSFQVTGIGTKINVNGTNFNSFTFQNVTDITIALNGGNDSLTFTNSTVNGLISIDMGDGNDVLTMANVHEITTLGSELRSARVAPRAVAKLAATPNDANITLGTGNDVATLVNVTADGDIILDAGAGIDVVTLNRVTAGTVGSGNSLSVEMGPGRADVLTVANSTADAASFSDTDGSFGVLSFKRLHNNFGEETNDGFTIVV